MTAKEPKEKGLVNSPYNPLSWDMTAGGILHLGDPADFLVWRKGSGDTVEILDIAVGSERRKGKGKALVKKLFGMLPKDTQVWAITRYGNRIAQEFYEALGFRVVAYLNGFYDFFQKIDAVMYGRQSGEI